MVEDLRARPLHERERRCGHYAARRVMRSAGSTTSKASSRNGEGTIKAVPRLLAQDANPFNIRQSDAAAISREARKDKRIRCGGCWFGRELTLEVRLLILTAGGYLARRDRRGVVSHKEESPDIEKQLQVLDVSIVDVLSHSGTATGFNAACTSCAVRRRLHLYRCPIK